jgi:acetylornithine/succinyldiaminopimelate/putrescine aminotransferase
MPNTGPVAPSGQRVRYGSIEDLQTALERDSAKIAAFMIEPIQGAAGYDTRSALAYTREAPPTNPLPASSHRLMVI